MIEYNCDQRSEAWYDARLGRITGTRFKDLMADEKTKTYQDLITDLACEMITGRAEETYTNSIMEKGIETEPEARKEYENITGLKVKEVGFIIPDENTIYHNWIGISPDGLTPDNGMIEIKCPLMKTHLGYITDGKLPAEYRYQIQGQLFVTELDYCDFVSYCVGMKPFIIQVKPDKALFLEFQKRLNILIEQVNQKIDKYIKYDYL